MKRERSGGEGRECSRVGMRLRCMQEITSSNLVISRGRKKRRMQRKGKGKRKKERKKRERVEKNWKERRERKSQRKDERKERKEKEKEERKEKLEKREGKRTRVRNRCVETGYGRSVIRWFRMTGLKVREKGLKGELPGRYKGAW